jgi:GNAT superfamily N-acetyltransferase
MTVQVLTVVMTIRPAAPEDVDGIGHVLLESAAHHASLDPERYFVPSLEMLTTRYRDRMRRPDDRESSVLMVADVSGEIVGFAEARLERSPDPMHRAVQFCHVGEIAVRARYRSHGIGARLLGAVEDWGRRHGAAFASLEYHAANTRAGAFYQRRMGYATAAVTAIKRLDKPDNTPNGGGE